MADPLSRKKAKDGPAEGCLGLGFKGQMNRVGGAAPRTPPPPGKREGKGGSRDSAWKAGLRTQELLKNVTAELNFDTRKYIVVQDISGPENGTSPEK